MAPLPEPTEGGVQKQALGQVVACECVCQGWDGGVHLGWWLEALCRGRPPTPHKMPSLNGFRLGTESRGQGLEVGP